MACLRACGPDGENCVTLARHSECGAEEGLRIAQEEPDSTSAPVLGKHSFNGPSHYSDIKSCRFITYKVMM